MRHFLPILAASVLLISLSDTGRAADFYVDGNNGSNSYGDGSKSAPWKTITHALQNIPLPAPVQGHTLHVLEGFYEASAGETFPISVPAGVQLRGVDPSRSLIYGTKKAGLALLTFTGNTDLRNVISGLGIHEGDPGISIPGTIGAGQGPVIMDCRIMYNLVGLEIEGPVSGTRDPSVHSCLFTGNTGKCIHLIGAPGSKLGGRIIACRMDHNQGTGMDIDATLGNVSTAISNCTSIMNAGNGIQFKGTSASSPLITHVTARANSGAGLQVVSGSSPSGIQIRNSIFHGNQMDFMDVPASVVTHCCFGMATGSNPPVGNQNGNLQADPRFKGYDEPDLTPFSPAIDRAAFNANLDPVTDYAGESRNTDGDGNAVHGPDMGADEYMPLYYTGFAPMPGSFNFVSFDLPSNVSIPYYLGLSFSNAGIPIAGKRILPLWPDVLLFLCLGGTLKPYLVDFVGYMNAYGFGRARIHWPNNPGLRGITFYLAGITIQNGYPGIIRCVSNGVEFTL